MNNVCPSCGAVYSVTAQHVGRKIACKKCSVPLVVGTQGLQLASSLSNLESGFPALDANPFGSMTTAPSATTPPPATVPPPLPPQEPEAAPPRAQSSAFMDYLLFRRMIMPFLIQVLFWMGVAGCIVFGLVTILTVLLSSAKVGAAEVVISLGMGLGQILLGPLVLRLYCELVMVLFRMHDTLRDIKEELVEQSKSR